jgi:adenine-specific DNA-methyltransferase
MEHCLDKFQKLLRELFQFDCADLDFGIYRIMNYKRDVIEKFISQDLPKAVADELDRGALADQDHAAKELKEVAVQITQTLGKDALDADGNLAATYHGTPLGTKYLNLKARAAGGPSSEALEASIFNHLYTFFSRYYQDGDFISKRRYSKRQRYAIPYNGEEVYLHWANNDQYYVKTAANPCLGPTQCRQCRMPQCARESPSPPAFRLLHARVRIPLSCRILQALHRMT